MEAGKVRTFVRERYGEIASKGGSCCGPGASCGSGAGAGEAARRIGYTPGEIAAAPEGSNLGLGSGNPVALAALRKGETVLDLGSGAGFDCFLAAREVGPEGRVIGIDMTPAMVEKARANAARAGVANVEFRLGEIEHLPVADGSIDAILSNCVINLSPEKEAVFAEAFRVLRPGGRLMVSDVVLAGELPDGLRDSAAAHAGCVAGAIREEEYLAALERAGFREVRVVDASGFDPSAPAGEGRPPVVGVRIAAVKPAA